MSEATSTASGLQRELQSGRFVITAELSPPVSTDPAEFIARGLPLKGLATAVNVTDGAGAKAHLSSLVACHFLLQNGIEPILQFTCRDRNRIALQGDLRGTGAAACADTGNRRRAYHGAGLSVRRARGDTQVGSGGRAEGGDVIFAQQNAEQTDLADASFDLVTSHWLLHQMIALAIPSRTPMKTPLELQTVETAADLPGYEYTNITGFVVQAADHRAAEP